MKAGDRGLAKLARDFHSPWKSRRRSGLLAGWYLDRLTKRRAWLERANIQPEPFLRILELKLENDARGPSGQPEGMMSVGLALLFAFSWLAGLVPVIFALVAEPPGLWWMASVSAVQAFLLVFFLLGMYDTILVDATDVATVAPLPVSDRTLFATRIAHIAFYIGLMSLFLCFFPMFLGPLRYTWWAVLVCVPLVSGLTAVLCIGGVSLFYALLLRLLGGARFQRASTYGQVLAMVALMAGPQLVLRVFPMRAAAQAFDGDARWRFALPPAWFGGLFELVEGRLDGRTLLLASLALFVPLALLALALQLASRHFVAALATGPARERGTSTRWPRPWSARLARLFCRSREETAGWHLALAQVRRDHLFVRGAWPGFIGSTVIGMAIVLPMRGAKHSLPPEFTVYGPYMCGLAFAGVLLLLRFSEHAKARWLYAAAPLADGAAIVRGAAKALVFSILLPVQVAISVVPLVLGGWQLLPNLALVWLATSTVVLIAIPHLIRDMPFTHDQTPGRMQTDAIVPALLYSLSFMLVGGLQAAASLHWAGLLLFAGLFAWLACVGWKRLARIRLAPMPPV